MIKNKSLLALSFLIAIFTQQSSLAADTGNIIVKVTGLHNNNGVVRIALFNKKEAYAASKSGEQAFQKMKTPINGQQAQATFESVPYGNYAIKLFHDEDDSGRFLTNTFGMPKVEYGFSNNAKGFMGPAPFEKAEFKLNNPSLEMPIKMQGK